jgi:ABC-2 type transport system permease protein
VNRRFPGRLLWLWTVQQVRQLFRNPQASFFTIVFPLLFLGLFGGLNHGATIDMGGGKITFAQYYTPGLAIFAVVTACLTGLVISVSIERDQLILKRVRSTPMPPWIYITARIGATIVMAIVTTVILFLVGTLALGVHLYLRLLPAAIVTFLIGTATFAAIGMAVSCLVPNSDAAPAIANIVALPMVFVSGVFFPLQGAPAWLVKIADFLPLIHLVRPFIETFEPFTRGSGFAPRELLVVALWGLAATAFAARRFRWEPAAGKPEKGRRPTAHARA